MNKEKMIQIVKEQLPEATSGASYYTRGNIPRNKFIYARNAFGSSSIEFEDVIGLTDETIPAFSNSLMYSEHVLSSTPILSAISLRRTDPLDIADSVARYL